MKRLWVVCVLGLLPGCVGLEEFLFPYDYYDEVIYESAAPVYHQPGVATQGTPIAPAAYRPPASTREPELLNPQK